MKDKINHQSHVDRFLGFQELYDANRPAAPKRVTELLALYRGKEPELVVDVGCGTGLSTFIWSGIAQRIIGVEPNPDMRMKAEAKLQAAGTGAISFRPGYSNDLGLADGEADIITCSQSFHWMEPVSTLQEFGRVLADGGVFGAYDCDWPPCIGWEAEQAYNKLIAKAAEILTRLVPSEEAVKQLDKSEHLARMKKSGVFRFVKEIVFHNEELCDANRILGLAMSQGGVQSVIKLGAAAELRDELGQFQALTETAFNGESRMVLLGYRLRLGVK
ncbi:MAG: SAM-dependent methyltransferase [Paenibacillaceae bacterium]|jgi:ubiquinone/menaquinone biosynthesis C-methylase UbiE|nr:SAM-dependent methyltransferase [Paenibacillaceae bacterium]